MPPTKLFLFFVAFALIMMFPRPMMEIYTMAILLAFFTWLLLMTFIQYDTAQPEIYYVSQRPAEIKMKTRFYDPFNVEVHLGNSSILGVKCTLRSQGPCYGQAMWGLPIYDLIECLNKDWPAIINSITSHNVEETLCFQSVYGHQPIVFKNDLVTEFKIPSDLRHALEMPHENYQPRTIYPFVLFMVLLQKENEGKFPAPHVIASAHAIHFSDAFYKKPVVISHYVKVSSGAVGRVHKPFRETTPGSDLCLICYNEPATIVLISCSHFCLCRSCYERCEKCPLCRNTCMDFFELPPLH